MTAVRAQGYKSGGTIACVQITALNRLHRLMFPSGVA